MTTAGSTGADGRRTCRVSSHLTFTVSEAVELVVQVAAARSSGHVEDERLDVTGGAGEALAIEELTDHHGGRVQVVRAPVGRLTVDYGASIRLPTPDAHGLVVPGDGGYERLAFLRPSRYCPTDRLMGFAMTEFGTGADVGARIAAITEWIHRRISYVPGSGTVHDSAEHTLLTGKGSCRDFAHVGIALCRGTGIPARFAAVYAPGLDPMDFHAVFETFVGGRWMLHDATGLAPRQSMVRIATGRDAADTAFAAVNTGIADLVDFEVSAVVDPRLPHDDASLPVELA